MEESARKNPEAYNEAIDSVDIPSLAKELGGVEYQLPQEYYTQADAMLHNFYEHIIPETLEIPINQIGTFLVENKDRILSLFEQYPLMWRWPLCLLQDQIDDRITHSIRASLQEKPTDDILERLSKAIDNTIILLCFCLVLTRNKKSSEMKRKYGNVLEKTRIAEYIHDEIEFQITTSWGKRYENLMRHILREKFDSIMSDIDFQKQISIPEKDIGRVLQEEKKQFRQERRHERIFVANADSKRCPEHDVEGINFILCQKNLYGCSPLIQSLGEHTDYIPVWKAWMSTYKWKLINPNNEINKIFRYAFQISGPLIVDEEITEETKEKLPAELYGILMRWMVESGKKNKKPRNEKTKKIQTPVCEGVAGILGTIKTPEKTTPSPAPKIIFDRETKEDISLENMPLGTNRIELRIYNIKGKIVGFGTYNYSGDQASAHISLKDPNWNNTSISAQNPTLLGNNFTGFKEGEKYCLGVTALGINGKTDEGKTEQFLIPRKQIEPTVPVPERISAILVPSPPSGDTPQTPTKLQIIAPPTVPIIPDATKNPKESEKEDLEIALEFFLEAYSQDDLLAKLSDSAVWDEEEHTLMINIPVEILEECGYEPVYLEPTEYHPLLQWKASINKGKCTEIPSDTPSKIIDIFLPIYTDMLGQREKSKIDDMLASLGIPPSETDDNAHLRKTIEKNRANLDMKALESQLKELNRGLGKSHSIYSPPSKEKKIQSLCLLSKGNWMVILTLSPTVSVELKSIHDTPIPFQKDMMVRRIENALLNILYSCLKHTERGIKGMIRRTHHQENTQKLKKAYREELKKKTARLLVEKTDGTFEVITGVSLEELESTTHNLQEQYGVGSIGLLYRRDTYAFLGENCICRPSPQASEEDYINLNLPERKEILRERVLKTLFNGTSGVRDRSGFLHGSAVYAALQFEKTAFEEKHAGSKITKDDITDDFLDEFIDILRTREVLITYRDYCVGDITDIATGE